MNKIIPNLKLKIKNAKKRPRFAWIPLLPSMILFSILGLVSSNFDYYLAQQNPTSIRANILPNDGITVYTFPNYTQCAQSLSGGCLSLPKDITLSIQLLYHKRGWAIVKSCNKPFKCNQYINSYIPTHFVACQVNVPGCPIYQSFMEQLKYRTWVTQKQKEWKEMLEPFTSNKNPKLYKLVEGKTVQDIEATAMLLQEKNSIASLSNADLEKFSKIIRNEAVLKRLKKLSYAEWKLIKQSPQYSLKTYFSDLPDDTVDSIKLVAQIIVPAIGW